MEHELDLTLKLGLPNPTVETHLSLHTPTSAQVTNVGGGGLGDNNNNGGDELSIRRDLWGEVNNGSEGAGNNVDVNLRVYNYIFNLFAGAPNTLNFDPYPLPQSPPPPAPLTPSTRDYVLIDVPARRARRNNSLAMANANADANANANANFGWRRGYRGRRIGGTRMCTNLLCNAPETPMWRKGPLGPKSLCNACGIKFRKEEERRSQRN